jgi:hypothetical protein
VKKRQAHFAQYILLETGVPVRGRLLKGNFRQNAHTDRGSYPQHIPNEGTNKKGTKPTRQSGPQLSLISEINRWADKLGRL